MSELAFQCQLMVGGASSCGDPCPVASQGQFLDADFALEKLTHPSEPSSQKAG